MKTNKYKKNTKRLSKEPHKKTRYLRKKNTKRISKKPHKKTRYNKFTKKYKGGNATAKRRLSFGETQANSQSPLPDAKRQVTVFKYNTFEYLLELEGTFNINIISNLEGRYNNLEDQLLGQEIKYYGKIESYNDILKGRIHEFMKGNSMNEDDSIQLYYTKLKIHQNEKYNEQFERTQDHLEACKAAAAISKLGGLGDPYDSEEYQTQMDNFYKIEMIIELLKITIKLYRVFIKYFFFKNKEKSNIQLYLNRITDATSENEKQRLIRKVLTISLDFFSLNDPYDESSYPNEKDEIYLGTNIYTYNTKLPSIENYINYLSANILKLLGLENLNILTDMIYYSMDPTNNNNFISVLYDELVAGISLPLRL